MEFLSVPDPQGVGSGIHKDITSFSFSSNGDKSGFPLSHGGKLITKLCDKGILLRNGCKGMFIQCPVVCITIVKLCNRKGF